MSQRLATPRPTLAVDRVFVVRFAARDADEAGAGCLGQAEHVLSGRRRAFGCATELLLALDVDPGCTPATLNPLHPERRDR